MSSTPPAPKRKPWRKRTVLLIVLLALYLRVWAVFTLPIDFDEPVYLEAGADYARLVRAGDVGGVIDYAGVREHPPLVKLLYGGAWLVAGEEANPSLVLLLARGISAFFGTLAVAILTFVNPLAGGFFAVHMMVVKYTSQAYLEAVPLFTGLAAVLALRRSRSYRDLWFWLSAVALGATGAAKFTYFPVVVPVLYLLVGEQKRSWWQTVGYLAVAALAFWFFNPHLWNSPFERFLDSVFFHFRYSQSEHVQTSGYPWYQPVTWLLRAHPQEWHPRVFLYPGVDGLVTLLALFGLYWSWKEHRWAVIWAGATFLFLLIWPTKWPQYTLTLAAPLALMAAVPIPHIAEWLREQEFYWGWIRGLIIVPPKAAFIAAGAFFLFIVGIYTVYGISTTLERLKWYNVTPANSPLPSLTVYDFFARGEELVAGTQWGAIRYRFSQDLAEEADSWEHFVSGDSGLPHNRVLAVAEGDDGALWFATDAGLGIYDGTTWMTYSGADLGLAGSQFRALAPSDGVMWVGSDAGLVRFEDSSWDLYTTENSLLLDDYVFSLLAEETSATVWIGTRQGLSRFDAAAERWENFPAEEFGLGQAVADLALDATGRLWVATFGGGLLTYDGERWEAYRTSNSDLPFNLVTAVEVAEPGTVWVGTGRPGEEGGIVLTFDGTTWHEYRASNSGYSGAEPLEIVYDEERGQVWFGTRNAGIQIYTP